MLTSVFWWRSNTNIIHHLFQVSFTLNLQTPGYRWTVIQSTAVCFWFFFTFLLIFHAKNEIIIFLNLFNEIMALELATYYLFFKMSYFGQPCHDDCYVLTTLRQMLMLVFSMVELYIILCVTQWLVRCPVGRTLLPRISLPFLNSLNIIAAWRHSEVSLLASCIQFIWSYSFLLQIWHTWMQGQFYISFM